MGRPDRNDSCSRRRWLQLAASGMGLGLGALALPRVRARQRSETGGEPHGSGAHDPDPARTLPFDPTTSLRRFERGLVKQENGRSIREFGLEARSTTVPLGETIRFKAWTIDGGIPAPTLRARQGERIRVIFRNRDSTSHSLHFHGVHPAAMDGVEPVLFGGGAVYEFDLAAAGLYPYHCHVSPVARHVGKGMFGLLIVDPPQSRPPADELVLVMGGYDLHNSGRNDLYAFNGIPDHYMRHPIRIRQHQLVRLHLLNMVELEGPLTFHIHANTFRVVREGFSEITDVVTLGMAERQILEFRYPFTGRYMFHPHQDRIAERGCMGLFDVLPATGA